MSDFHELREQLQKQSWEPASCHVCEPCATYRIVALTDALMAFDALENSMRLELTSAINAYKQKLRAVENLLRETIKDQCEIGCLWELGSPYCKGCYYHTTTLPGMIALGVDVK